MQVQVNKWSILLLLLMILNLNGLYFVRAETFSIMGLNIHNMFLIAAVFVSFYIIINNKRALHEANNKYLIIGAYAIGCISAVVANYNYGQSLLSGLSAERLWFVALLMYFPIIALLRNERITTDQLIRTIFAFSMIELFIAFLQYFVGSRFVFTYTYSSERYGETRYYFSDCFIILAASFALGQYLKSKSKKSLAYLIIVFAYLLIVYKTRMRTICLAGAIIICVLLTKYNIGRKIIYVIIGIALLYVAANSTIGQDIINNISGNQDLGVEIREVGREFYLMQLLSSPVNLIFGLGYVNDQVSQSAYLSGITQGFNVSDNGLLGMIYYTGILGLIWYVVLYVKLFVVAWRELKRDGDCSALCYMLIDVLGLMTLTPSCFTRYFSFAAFMAITEVKNIQGEER